MLSERIQRQIDRLLDEAETAAAEKDWAYVADCARKVLAVDTGNEDAAAFLLMAEGQGSAPAQSATSSQPAAAPAAPSAPPLPTSFAGGRYEVQCFLGEGGRKRVYLAHDAKLDRDVAIAVIKTEGLDADGLTRVRREAQAMGRLGDHPHIVTVHDIGDEDGQPYIVSQYMEGGDLEGLLRGAESHRLSLDQAGRIASEVRQALEHAHSHGIIHRDLKPGNIWLTKGGTAKLGDFGLAVAVDRSRLTVEGMMVGTVAYMAPEQALGRQPDARSDLYSWGCVLYEMVTGRPPFLGDDAVAIISQHINTAAVAPTWHNPEVPRALESLILRCLAKNPDERPDSAAALSEALRAAMETATTVAGRAAEGEANPLDRLAGGVFVGREKEMDELRAGLEDALSGRGRLLMLVGEPGIGKTRTSEEFATYARLRSVQVLWGRCYEGEGAPVYWPWVQVIRSYVHDRDAKELMSEMGPGAADIAQVVSEVRERLPGLPAPPALEPEQARFRLFDSITTFLKNASKGQPVVLVLDDLHWADKPSLLLLQFLARELRGARLLVLGTYRDVEIRRQHPLAETLGELARQQLSQRILLRGLTERDVSRFIEVTAGISPPQALVEAVYRETEGNPFFVNEIVRLLVSDGRLERPGQVASWSVTIPQSVREVVGRRLDHLSEACNRALTSASVIGREFGVDALERVSDVSGDRLLEVMEEAVAARVVNEVPRTVGRYSFSHALIWETLYEELSTNRRVRLHRQIGEVLEELYGANPEPHLSELAHHFCEAAPGGDVEKAIGYARRAGDRAAALMAHEDAADHYAMALQALELQEKPNERLRCELLLALGEAQRRAGEPDKAPETLSQAFALAERLDDASLIGETAVAYALAAARGALLGQGAAVSYLRRALQAVGQEDSALRGMLLCALSGDLMILVGGWQLNLEEREALALEAKAIGERLGDPVVQANALWRLALTWGGPEHVKDRLAIAKEAIRLAEESDDIPLLLWGRYQTWADSLLLGDMGAMEREEESLLELAEQTREPHYQAWRSWRAGMRACMEGRYSEAEQLAQQLLLAGQRLQVPVYVQSSLVQLFDIRVNQGRGAELEGLVKGTVQQYPENMGWLAVLAYLYAILEREPEAREQFEKLAAEEFANIPDDLNYLGTIACTAYAARYLGDARRAGILYGMLLPYNGLTITANGGALCIGAASGYLGLLAETMGRLKEAEAHYQEAIAMNDRIGARPLLGHTRVLYAEMLLARGRPGDRHRALEQVDQALPIFQELGMKALLERALALKLKAQGIDISSPQTSIEAVAASVYADKPDLRNHAAPDGTVTIMFSDIEGSTVLTERLGDQRWQEVLREHNGLIREQLRAHDGFEVKTMGDGFMVAFQSAKKGLDCAIGIQCAFAERNERAEQPIRVRIGLHTGEAIREADDFFGKHVVLASRVADAASGGEILVSSVLKELTESAGDVRFGEACKVELKGLRGKHRLFQVAWE
jgi:eukaryotic-like serine/threonine-protein kinase